MKKEAALFKSLPLFYWFIHSEIFSLPLLQKKEPAIDIAGLCLPLKPQKERFQIFFH
jgi:hypothetical protein